MIKTIKEMRSKAEALQGDYLRAYEDMLDAFKNYVERREDYLESPVKGSYLTGQEIELEELKRFLFLEEK